MNRTAAPNFVAPFDTRSPAGFESRENSLDRQARPPLQMSAAIDGDGVVLTITPRDSSQSMLGEQSYRVYYSTAFLSSTAFAGSDLSTMRNFGVVVGEIPVAAKQGKQYLRDSINGRRPGWYLVVGVNGQGVESDPLPPVKSPRT